MDILPLAKMALSIVTPTDVVAILRLLELVLIKPETGVHPVPEHPKVLSRRI